MAEYTMSFPLHFNKSYVFLGTCYKKSVLCHYIPQYYINQFMEGCSITA